MINWNSMFTWALIFAGVAVLLAFALHFLVPAKGVKIPAVVIGTLGGLVVGVCIGMTAAVYYGDEVQKQVYSNEYSPEPMPSPGATKGQSTGGASTPPPAKKKSDEASSKAGPGSRSMPSNYPGMEGSTSKAKSEEAKDEGAGAGGEVKKSDAP